MRIIHTSDWHLGKNLEGQSRLLEQEQFLKDFIQIVNQNKADMVIIAGDVYDGPNPSAKAEQLFFETMEELSKNGERIILIVAGNHDNPERLTAAEPLARLHGIIISGTPRTIIPVGKYGKHSVTESGEGYIEVQINQEKAVILTVPFPSEKRLNEVIYQSFSEDEEKQKSYHERITLLFFALQKHFKKDTINLIVSHLFVSGVQEGGAERSISLGGSYRVESSCFPEQAQYIALGHVHRPQIVPGTGKRARYSGSPLPYNKKEANYQKKVILVDVKQQEDAVITDIMLKTYKKIELWKCSNYEEALIKCKENSNKESYVYLEIKTDSVIMENQIKKLRELKKDILEIMPITSNEMLEELPEEDLKEQSFEKVFKDFYYSEKGLEPNEELISVLLETVTEEEKNETTSIGN